jgi:hypothetical protein
LFATWRRCGEGSILTIRWRLNVKYKILDDVLDTTLCQKLTEATDEGWEIVGGLATCPIINSERGGKCYTGAYINNDVLYSVLLNHREYV